MTYQDCDQIGAQLEQWKTAGRSVEDIWREAERIYGERRDVWGMLQAALEAHIGPPSWVTR